MSDEALVRRRAETDPDMGDALVVLGNIQRLLLPGS
jgi:hypothetical protein